MKCRIMSNNCDHKAEPFGKPGGLFAFYVKEGENIEDKKGG